MFVTSLWIKQILAARELKSFRVAHAVLSEPASVARTLLSSVSVWHHTFRSISISDRQGVNLPIYASSQLLLAFQSRLNPRLALACPCFTA